MCVYVFVCMNMVFIYIGTKWNLWTKVFPGLDSLSLYIAISTQCVVSNVKYLYFHIRLKCVNFL